MDHPVLRSNHGVSSHSPPKAIFILSTASRASQRFREVITSRTSFQVCDYAAPQNPPHRDRGSPGRSWPMAMALGGNGGVGVSSSQRLRLRKAGLWKLYSSTKRWTDQEEAKRKSQRGGGDGGGKLERTDDRVGLLQQHNSTQNITITTGRFVIVMFLGPRLPW